MIRTLIRTLIGALIGTSNTTGCRHSSSLSTDTSTKRRRRARPRRRGRSTSSTTGTSGAAATTPRRTATGAITGRDGDFQIGPTAKSRARESQISRLIDIELIGAGVAAAFVGGDVGLAVIVRRRRRARVDNLHRDGVADAADVAPADGARVGHFVAGPAVVFRTARACVAGFCFRARTLRHVAHRAGAGAAGDVGGDVRGRGAVGSARS